MEKVLTTLLMVNGIKVIGLMIKDKDREQITQQMEIYTKDNGKVAQDMVLAY